MNTVVEARGFPLYLTGSCYFGYETEDSDLDYIAEYSPELEQALLEWGYSRKDSLRFKNRGVVDIYVNWEQRIHIALFEEVETKLKVQEIVKKWLTPKEIQSLLSKGDLCNRMWDMLCEVAQVGLDIANSNRDMKED